MNEPPGPGGGRRRQRRLRSARRRAERKKTEISPTSNRILIGMGLVFAVILALFAFGISGFVVRVAMPFIIDGDIAFLVGSAIIVALGAAAVSVAGTGIVRGIPFHIFGVVGPFMVGSTLEPFRELTILGPLIYLAAWCWAFLGESGYRLIRSGRGRNLNGSDYPATADPPPSTP